MTPPMTHMLAEIREIPDAIARLLDHGAAPIKAAGKALRDIDPRLIVTIARGSSDHVASYLKYAVELVAGIPVASVGPSVASIYGVTLNLERACAISISQSGKSPDIVAMAKAARAGGALTIGITNTQDSPLSETSEHALDILAGPERSVAATKTFVASTVAGLLLVAHWSQDAELMAALHELPGHLGNAIGCDWSALAGALDGRDSLFVLGRGPGMAIAEEAALKFKETCGMHADAYSAAEVMHGPLALVQQGFPVLALAARDRSEPSIAEAADALARRGAAVLATSEKVRKAERLPFVATGHPLTDPLVLVAAFYAFVEGHARSRGLDPDEPPNLRKVTETL